jgi:MOSC domain-containing protein YiiM
MENLEVPTVMAIHLAPAAREQMISVTEAHAVPGRGLEGDRYFAGVGTYSETEGAGREVTLIELEALDRLLDAYGIKLQLSESRRNITTRGISLNELIGHEFCIGAVRMLGIRPCEPCAHLVGLTGKKVLRGLVHHGGLRAEFITEGMIHVGDPILRV